MSDVAELEVEVSQYEKRKLQYGDIIIEKSGGSDTQAVGRVVFFDRKEGEYSYSNFTSRIRLISNKFDTKYLHLYLNYIYELGYTFDFQTGTSGIKNLNFELYLSTKIPIPPLEIQSKIVAECEQIDKAVDKAKEEITEIKGNIDILIDKIYSNNYPIKKLSTLIQIIGGGTPNTNKAEYWNGGIPWLSVADFNTGKRFVNTSEKTISELGLQNSSTKYLEIGDLIISARGTVGVVAQLAARMTFNQSCYGLRGLEEVDNGYLYYILNKEVAQFKNNAYGATFGSITTKTFDSIRIPVPPISIQQTLVSEIEVLEAQISAAQQIIASAAGEKQKVMELYL